MPEGDTIHRLAAKLAPALEGETVERFWARMIKGASPRAGETIGPVRAHGKHLLMDFSGGLTLDTHMGMTGSWALVRQGERWPREEHLARVRVRVPKVEAICFAAPTIRTLPTSRLDGNIGSADGQGPAGDAVADELGVGPDLAVGELDFDDLVERSHRFESNGVLADLLLDQRVAAGVGNVFVSEVCWHRQLHPEMPVGEVSDELVISLWRDAARLIRRNLTTRSRRTVAGGLAAYEQRGKPCRRCGAPITSARVGHWQRTAYWCPTCQPTPESS